MDSVVRRGKLGLGFLLVVPLAYRTLHGENRRSIRLFSLGHILDTHHCRVLRTILQARNHLRAWL